MSNKSAIFGFHFPEFCFGAVSSAFVIMLAFCLLSFFLIYSALLVSYVYVFFSFLYFLTSQPDNHKGLLEHMAFLLESLSTFYYDIT